MFERVIHWGCGKFPRVLVAAVVMEVLVVDDGFFTKRYTYAPVPVILVYGPRIEAGRKVWRAAACSDVDQWPEQWRGPDDLLIEVAHLISGLSSESVGTDESERATCGTRIESEGRT